MVPFRFNSVHIEGYKLMLPQNEVSSAELEDKLAPLYEKFKVPYGTLEKLSGVQTRRFFDRGYMPSKGGTDVANQLLAETGFDRDKITALLNCSVARDYFEPATASLIHQNMELREDAITFDVTNACIGFSDGLILLGNMIETGAVKAGLLVSCERVGPIIDTSIKLMNERIDELTREDFLEMLPSFTLGSGAAAMLLVHESIATSPRKYIGSVSRAGSQHSNLCAGNTDYCFAWELSGNPDFDPLMRTQSQKLIAAAAQLGKRSWDDFSEAFGWSADDVDHIFCHQVGKQVNTKFYKTMTLDIKKEFTVYQRYGNLVSASLPAALITGAEEKGMQQGEKILCTAFGSGLNAIFSGIIW